MSNDAYLSFIEDEDVPNIYRAILKRLRVHEVFDPTVALSAAEIGELTNKKASHIRNNIPTLCVLGFVSYSPP